MNDHVVDTNVLLVASAAHPYSPFGDTHLPAKEQRVVFEWLATFRAAAGRRIVLDREWKIMSEYKNKLTEQDYGLQVAIEKMSTGHWVTLEWDRNGHAVVPSSFAGFDPSDRKLLAAALTDPSSINIVNAADSDWLDVEPQLKAAGVTVEHLVGDWLRRSHGER